MRATTSAAAFEQHLLHAMPALYQRVRRPAIAAVAARVQGARRLANLELSSTVPALIDAIGQIGGELARADADLASLNRRWSADPTEATVRAYLAESCPPGVLKAEVAALDRWLSIDALRERIERRRQLLLVEEETALRAVASILRAQCCGPTRRAEGGVRRESPASPGLTSLVDGSGESFAPEALHHAGLVLLDRALASSRLQNQLAGCEAFRALLVAAPSVVALVPDIPLALSAHLELPELHPFVAGEALAALLMADPGEGLAVLRRRFERPSGGKDFLFRRYALELCTPLLAEDERRALLGHVLRSDPSEYVRLGACELAGAAELSLLEESAGLASPPESSAKVRASALLAMVRIARADGGAARRVLEALGRIVDRDEAELVLRLGCEQLRTLAGVIEPEVISGVAPALIAVLARLRTERGCSGLVLEAAAQADQALARAADPVRRAWTLHLAEVARGIESGSGIRLVVEPAPADLPPLPEDPEWLGAVLAELSAADFGLYAERRGSKLHLWRGDRFERRAWRVWHELRRPAPNKRQAFHHTVGRRMRGALRAHPARLEEITETVVPGERVHVPSEGGWARHLPTIDDLLDLPVASARPIKIFSSHGVTTVRPAPTFWQRLRNRARITLRYRELAGLRLASLAGGEERERRRFAEKVKQELGIELTFQPYRDGEAIPARLRSLFDQGGGRLQAIALALLGVDGWLAQARERLFENDSYFLGTGGNGLGALAIFTAALFSWFLWSAWSRRQGVRTARASVPLCIGGWGTRGKSGTERLKAALLGGLGFDVFAKTTGSEAMFVHSAPGAAPCEFFIYRPYDKATIWEQRDMVDLGAKLGTEVFLWECMALQPSFVELLQNDWMKDDFATLTNAYPDHEDIQGPAGLNVAQVITNFMPNGRTVITTEDHFLPLFEDAAKRRGSKLLHSPWWEAELIPDELLDLFPYREHPRNMALVATLAEQLGVPRTQALALMAEHVQPEIGVLKVFPDAKVRGRVLSFINGHSANERTGFLNNWNRLKLGEVDPERDADRAVLTVINNRWDRVSRSEVFARIMVEDAAADRHVLIGTNLVGLQKYARRALAEHLERLEVVAVEDLRDAAGLRTAEQRLARELARLKIPRPSATFFLDRLERYGRGAQLVVNRTAELEAAIERALFADSGELRVDRVRAELEKELGAMLEQALAPGATDVDSSLPETLEPASAEEVRTHALYLLARMAIHARLHRLLPREGQPASTVAEFHERFKEAYTGLFLEQLVVVEDALATGDQVIDACARAAAPGMRVSIMGAQNIKGTGLDWVYRWFALDRVKSAIAVLRSSTAPETRRKALETLENFTDHGLVDTGLAKVALRELMAEAAPEEAERLTQLADAAAREHAAKVAALRHVRVGTWKDKAVSVAETALDYLDSVRRRSIADQLLEDLVAGRVSHARAAVETRKLYERQKGGWLVDDLAAVARTAKKVFTRRPKTVPAPAPEPVLPVEPNLRRVFERARAVRDLKSTPGAGNRLEVGAGPFDGAPKA